MSCSDGDYAWRHAVGIGNWTSAPSGRLLVMWSTSATHEWCITWDYCPCYLVNNCGSYLKEENGACIAHRWRHFT
jgi:hypothetical protein